MPESRLTLNFLPRYNVNRLTSPRSRYYTELSGVFHLRYLQSTAQRLDQLLQRRPGTDQLLRKPGAASPESSSSRTCLTLSGSGPRKNLRRSTRASVWPWKRSRPGICSRSPRISRSRKPWGGRPTAGENSTTGISRRLTISSMGRGAGRSSSQTS